MEEYFEILARCPLFLGIEQENLGTVVDCLNGKTLKANKGDTVFMAGDAVQYIGVVLSGAVQIVRDDYYGNRSVMAIMEAGGMFAEAFVCAELTNMPASVIAIQPSVILLLDCKNVIEADQCDCQFTRQVRRNLLRSTAQKNLLLTEKIRYMSQKTTKDKLMAFLMDQAKQQCSSKFTIPYDRQGLAEYLGVERSAMSTEINKLKKSGQLDTKGSWFLLKQNTNEQ
jgi:CRP-like cAMP-binding protein